LPSHLAQLEAWAEQWPPCNWGLATGKASGLFVIDVDGPKGRAALEELASQGFMLTETLAVTTGRADGGEHRYRMPTGVDIRNDQNGKMARHIDVRGTGGFIVAHRQFAPSGNDIASSKPMRRLQMLQHGSSNGSPGAWLRVPQ
jgi:hypothetical protein